MNISIIDYLLQPESNFNFVPHGNECSGIKPLHALSPVQREAEVSKDLARGSNLNGIFLKVWTLLPVPTRS